MKRYSLSKPFLLAKLFIKEQFKEPVALFWTVISPVVTYYLIAYARAPLSTAASSYLSTTSWFYAFISSSVALFGLAFYIVGRRESGFLRSFVYTQKTKAVFLQGQFLAYSLISIIYCSVFYFFTYGCLDVPTLFIVAGRFYVCFLIFSIPSLLLTLLPLGFQNANTVFSMLSLMMLALGIVSVSSVNPVLNVLRFFNPMWWANQIMLEGVAEHASMLLVIGVLFMFSFWLVLRFLLINPVWSRY